MKTTLLTAKFKNCAIVSSVFLGMIVTLCFTSCQSPDEKAQVLLDQAKVATKAESYTEALDILDSLQKTFPKAFNTRHLANKLKLEVQLAQQQKNDSFLLIQLKEVNRQIDSLLANKAIVKQQDKKYQDAPFYIYRRIHSSDATPKLALYAAEKAQDGYIRLYVRGDKKSIQGLQVNDLDNNWISVSGDIHTHVTKVGGTHTLIDMKLQDVAPALEAYLKTKKSKSAKAIIKLVLSADKTEKMPTLSSYEIKGIETILPLHQVFASKKSLEELSKECTLKQRFIKKRLESYE